MGLLRSAGRQPRCTSDFVALHARRRPGHTAVISDSGETSYAALAAELRSMISALSQLRLPKGALVAVAHADSHACLLIVLAFEHLGVIVTLFRPGEGEAADGILAASDLVMSPDTIAPTRRKAFLQVTDAWLAAALSHSAGPSPRSSISADDPMLLVRSSGSTGRPKLMAITRAVVDLRIAYRIVCMGFDRTNRFLVTNNFNVTAVLYAALACLRLGATVMSCPSVPLAQALERLKPTRMSMLPFQLATLLAVPGNVPKLPDLEVMVTGGTLAPVLRRRALDHLCGRVLHFYATNELGMICKFDDDNLGTLLPGISVDIVGNDGASLPLGTVGEICVRSLAGISAYYGNPPPVAAPLTNGWWHTGDFGLLTPQGRLRLLGRRDDVINLGGIKRAAADIEAAIVALGVVQDMAVFAGQDKEGGPRIVVCVAAEADAVVAGIASRIRAAMGTGFSVFRVDAIPRTPEGKTRRAVLQQQVADGQPVPPAPAEPAGAQTLERGIAHHRAGRLPEAEALYQALLAADPRNADALHLLGVVADARGNAPRAVELIKQALQVRDVPRFHSNLGMALGHLGRHDEALAAYQRALHLRPDYPEALNNLGTTLEALGRPAEAADAFRRALALQPEQAEWWSNLGNVLSTLRQAEAAEAAYRRAVALSPALPRAHAQLGNALRKDGRPAEAEAAFRAQLALSPDDPEAHLNLAAALGEQGRAAEATAILPGALALAPDRPEAHHNLATALRQLGRLGEAEAAARRALALRPDYADALGNFGLILREQGRLDEAEPPLRRALALQPATVRAYNDLAIVLADQARLHEALAVLDLAAALDPADPETRHHRALLLLLQGRLGEGWAEYEVRFDTKQGRADRRGFAQPRWKGEALEGRTILLHAEQGLGDTLQFCRYAPLVARRGGRVLLEVQPALRSLLASLPGVAQLVTQGEALPPFDLCCPLLSLPLAFGLAVAADPGADWGTAPAEMPYLAPPAEALAHWRERLPPGGPPRVGVVWAGNPRHVNDRRRSLPFAALAPLWDVPGVCWASLQVGPQTADLGRAPPGLIEDLASGLHDFAETAAAVCQLDLVITADTAVAHLAGALGKPAFVLLPFVPDWRWLRGGDGSPWYPTLRLFRQDARRQWEPVVAAVAAALSLRTTVTL